MRNSLLLFTVVCCLALVGCQTGTQLPPKPPGFAELRGNAASFMSIFKDNDSNVFIVEIDGDAKDGLMNSVAYLSPGIHRVGFYAHSMEHRTEIIRFEFTAKPNAQYLIKAHSGGTIIKLSLQETAHGVASTLLDWTLPTVYSRGQGATLPIFIPAK